MMGFFMVCRAYINENHASLYLHIRFKNNSYICSHRINYLSCLPTIMRDKRKNIHMIIIVFLLLSSSVGGTNKLDSLLVLLDKAIENSEKYNLVKKERIRDLTAKIESTSPLSMERYNLNSDLIQEYIPYVCDSAIVCLNENIRIAEHLKNENCKYESRIRLSYLMSSIGMYKEAFDLLDSVGHRLLSPDLMIRYYNAYDHAYGEMSIYTQDPDFSAIYYDMARHYKDSLERILPEDSELRLIMKENHRRDYNQWEEALKINDMRLAKVEFGTTAYALVAFHRSLTYRNQGNIEEQKHYLALSALSDILSATKDHASLWMLADILYREGSIERAYRYIRFSWDDTVFYNARLRSQQSAGIRSLIDKTYQATLEKKSRQLRDYAILISVLSLLLIGTLIYIYRQMQRLSATRTRLHVANTQLNQLNEDLKQMNNQLQSTNMDLSESNRIKEEYIGRFIKLCSFYIDKFDSFRKMVKKKIQPEYSSKSKSLHV